MNKLADLKIKALLLILFTWSGSTVSGINDFPPVHDELNLLTTPKILQWNNQSRLEAPVAGGALVQGVYLSFSDGGEGSVWNEMEVNKLVSAPETNPTTTAWWTDGSALNLFAGEAKRMAVTFQLSTKYLKQVNDLEIVLDANRFEGANMDLDFDLKLEVFDLNGIPVPYSSVYAGGTSSFGVIPGIYNTGDGRKVLKFFQHSTDPGVPSPFIPGSLDNKLLRITLVSGIPVGEIGAHAPAALVVNRISIQSETPSLNLDLSNHGVFEAGMNCMTPFVPENTVTLSASGLTLPASVVPTSQVTTKGAVQTPDIRIVSPLGFRLNDGQNQPVDSREVTLQSTSMSFQYAFNPVNINTFNGSFAVAAQFTNQNDPLSPIEELTTTSASVAGNSVPELFLSANKITFNESGSTQSVQIWGKNIPMDDRSDFYYEGICSSDDPDGSTWSFAQVENHFTVSNLGVIEKLPSNTLDITFAQEMNNLYLDVAKYLRINTNYSIPLAIKGVNTFTGAEYADFSNAAINLSPFPQVLVIGDVAVVWFEYEKAGGVPGMVVGDLSTAFYAPYDETIAETLYSRPKTFVLKGAKIKPDANDEAAFEISLEKYGAHELDGHHAFMYSTDQGATWKTPATKDTLRVKLLTVQDAVDFAEKGVKLMVRFRPDCRGYEPWMQTATALPQPHEMYKWTPHHNLLKAVQVGKMETVHTEALVYGDTRAVLTNTINSWHFEDVMDTNYMGIWGSSLTTSNFRKDYGITYLNTCGEQSNPLNKGEFYITGYNLINNVRVHYYKDVNNPSAFQVSVEALEGFGEVDGLTIKPNKYGEVVARVSVVFAPTMKAADCRTVTDSITVVYSGKAIRSSSDQVWDPNFNYNDYFRGYDADNSFIYASYNYPAAQIRGQVYEPTFHKVEVADLTTSVNTSATGRFTFMATDLDRSKKKVSIALVGSKTSPFSITPTEFPIDANGNVSAEVTLTFTPTPQNLCDNQISAMTYTYGDCQQGDLPFSGVLGTTVVGQPTFQPFEAGDIQGDRADLRIVPAMGADNYQVGIGILKYSKKTSSIFMSEVYAKSNVIYVELFNGTGEKLNEEILVEGSPNYYLEVYEGDNLVKSVTIGATDSLLWNPYGITIKTIPLDLLSNQNYRIQLKQGRLSLDVYEFTGDVSHKTKRDDLPADSYLCDTFQEQSWTTVGGWHTSLGYAAQEPRYASMFLDEVNGAGFREYFDTQSVERSSYGFDSGLSVSGLKKGTTYTAYAYTVSPCEGVTVHGTPSVKLIPCSDSDRLSGDPMEGVRFGYFTGVDRLDAKQKIYASEGKIVAVGITEPLSVYNALGIKMKTATAEEAYSGISVPAGIYMVKSGSLSTKVVVGR